jgi:hypothetical protein
MITISGKARRMPGFFYARDYVQDERYFAMEHMDMRRDLVRFTLRIFEFCLIGNSLLLRQGIRGHAVPHFRTRCEYIHVRSGATSLSLKVLKRGTAHPLLRAYAWANGF